MEAKYSKTEFIGFTHRFKVEFKTDKPHNSNFDIYSNSDSYKKLEDFINEKKSKEVLSFKIINRSTKEQDEMSAKFIDEILNNI